MTRGWWDVLGWAGAAAAAFGLASVAPSESTVMGRLPAADARPLFAASRTLPEAMPAERTLALVNFNKAQRGEVESWVRGLGLDGDPTIPWIRMPVVQDPGHETGRAALQRKLLERYPSDRDRSHLLPVYADREAFVRAAGLSGTDRAHVLVLSRNGDVLARAEGEFDQDKAAALRETLLARAD